MNLRGYLLFLALLPASAAPWRPLPAPVPPIVAVPEPPPQLTEAPRAAHELTTAPTAPHELTSADTVGVLLARRLGGAPAPAVDRYFLYLPPGIAESGRSWPVVLYLHGRSLRGDDLSLLERYGLPRYLAAGHALPFIVIAPQLPDGQSWTDVDRLASLVRSVLERYPADRDRVYLTGYSMGGGGVWRLAQTHPDLFAAAAPVAALTPEPSPAWTRAVARLPLRIYHGTADEAAPYVGAEQMARALRAAGADVELRSFPGARHGDLTRVYGDADLFAWFLAHRRGDRTTP